MASATPTWLDKLLSKLIALAGVQQPQRGTLDFAAGFTVTDDPTNDTLHITAVGTAGLPGQTNLTLANGSNENVDPASKTVLRIGGPTAAFSIGGFVAPAAPVTLIVINTTAQPLTLKQESAASSAANRLNVQFAGGNAILQPRTGTAVFTYDTTAARWQLTSIGPSQPTIFNVRELGARGDGTTDDSTAIASTIALAAAVGGVVYFPATGSYYRLLSTLTLPANVRLLGDHSQNTGAVNLGSVLRWEGVPGLSISTQEISIENLLLTGDATSGPIITSPTASISGYWRFRNVRIKCGNPAKEGMKLGANGNNNGCQNLWSTFERFDILAAPAQSVPLISLFGVGGGMGLLTFKHCVLTGGGLVGSGNESTAEFIHVEATDNLPLELVDFFDVSLEIPIHGGWVLKSVKNMTLRHCWAGDLTGHAALAALILFSQSSNTGALPSEGLLIDTMYTDVGEVTSGLETVHYAFASAQGNVCILNSKIPSIGNEGPNLFPITSINSDIGHVNGDLPVGVNTVGFNGDVSAYLLAAKEAVASIANGLNHDVTPNVFSSYYRLTGSPSAPFSIGGLANAPLPAGRMLVIDARGLGQPMTIVDEDTGSTATYRIWTPTRAPVTVGNGAAIFIYDGDLGRWRLIGSATTPVTSGTPTTQLNQEVSFADFEHLTGISTQATLNIPLTTSGSSATILVDAISRVTTAGGTAVVGDTYTASIQFGAKNVGGTVSRVGALNTPYAVDTDGSMSTCAFSTNVTGTTFQVILTMPATFGAGTVVDTTLKARVVYS